MIIVLMIAEFNRPGPARLAKTAAAIVLFTIVLSGIFEHRSKIYYSPDLPRWQEEVQLWRMDNSHRLNIWPQFVGHRWDMELVPKDIK
jgi:hypothetical protein